MFNFTVRFQLFLRFWLIYTYVLFSVYIFILFQPFLRFWTIQISKHGHGMNSFQPFLRFWGSHIWFLWVFKFFLGFV